MAVFEADSITGCISVSVNVTTVHTNETATGNIPRAPESRNLVGVVYCDIFKSNMIIVSSSCATCNTDDTTVTGVVNSWVRICNCYIFKCRFACCICRDHTCGSEFSVRGEFINCKVLYSTVVNVTEYAHSFIPVITIVITLHLPGILIDIGDGITVSVKYASKRATICIPIGRLCVCIHIHNALCECGVFLVVNKFGNVVGCNVCDSATGFMITDRIEDDALVCIICTTKIDICDKLVVLIAVILIIIGNKIAEVNELVSVCDKIWIFLGTATTCEACRNVSFPNGISLCNHSYLGEGCHCESYVTCCGIVVEFVMSIEFFETIYKDHSNRGIILHVIDSVVTNVETCLHSLLNGDDHRNGIISRYT